MSFWKRLFGGSKTKSESKVLPFNEDLIELIIIICGAPKLQMTETEGKTVYAKCNPGWSGRGCVKVVNTTKVDECTTDVSSEYMRATNDTLVIVQSLDSSGHVFRFITVVRGMNSNRIVFLGGPIPFQALLDKEAEVNANSVEVDTALIMASRRGDLEVVQALLAKGAKVNAKANNGVTAMMVASKEGHREVVEALVDKGAKVNAKENHGAFALYLASQEGHREVVQVLLDGGAEVNAKANDGVTAMMVASQKGNSAVVQVLLDRGAEVNTQAKDGMTALMVASYNGDRKVVQALLNKGADVNVRTADGRTALGAATAGGDFESVTQPTGLRITFGSSPAGGHSEVRALLLRAGAKR